MAASMVFFESGRCDLDGAIDALVRRGLSVDRSGDRIAVTWPGVPDSPRLVVILVTEPFVLTEAAEIGEGTEHADAMRRCDARFEIVIEDLDAALDEINTLIEVQATLQDASRGYLFNDWNGQLSEPEPGR